MLLQASHQVAESSSNVQMHDFFKKKGIACTWNLQALEGIHYQKSF